MQQAQCAQRFDERQFTGIEIVKLVVAVHQFRQLTQAVLTITREHHPDILHRRAHAAVVEIDDVEDVVAGHHVAGVAIAVHADVLMGRGGVDVFDALEQVFGNGFIGRQQAARNHVVVQQVVQRVVAEVLHAKGFAVLERARGANGMDAAQQLAETVKLLEIAGFWRATATTGEEGETKTGVLEQGLAVVDEGRDDRDFDVGEFGGEAVLFENGFVGPAIGPVELGNQRLLFIDADLIDAVLIAVERENTGVGDKADALDGVQHQVRCKCCERVGHANSCAQQAAASGQSW
jgi:hypothetical protein